MPDAVKLSWCRIIHTTNRMLTWLALQDTVRTVRRIQFYGFFITFAIITKNWKDCKQVYISKTFFYNTFLCLLLQQTFQISESLSQIRWPLKKYGEILNTHFSKGSWEETTQPHLGNIIKYRFCTKVCTTVTHFNYWLPTIKWYAF